MPDSFLHKAKEKHIFSIDSVISSIIQEVPMGRGDTVSVDFNRQTGVISSLRVGRNTLAHNTKSYKKVRSVFQKVYGKKTLFDRIKDSIYQFCMSFCLRKVDKLTSAIFSQEEAIPSDPLSFYKEQKACVLSKASHTFAHAVLKFLHLVSDESFEEEVRYRFQADLNTALQGRNIAMITSDKFRQMDWFVDLEGDNIALIERLVKLPHNRIPIDILQKIPVTEKNKARLCSVWTAIADDAFRQEAVTRLSMVRNFVPRELIGQEAQERIERCLDEYINDYLLEPFIIMDKSGKTLAEYLSTTRSVTDDRFEQRVYEKVKSSYENGDKIPNDALLGYYLAFDQQALDKKVMENLYQIAFEEFGYSKEQINQLRSFHEQQIVGDRQLSYEQAVYGENVIVTITQQHESGLTAAQQKDLVFITRVFYKANSKKEITDEEREGVFNALNRLASYEHMGSILQKFLSREEEVPGIGALFANKSFLPPLGITTEVIEFCDVYVRKIKNVNAFETSSRQIIEKANNWKQSYLDQSRFSPVTFTIEEIGYLSNLSRLYTKGKPFFQGLKKIGLDAPAFGCVGIEQITKEAERQLSRQIRLCHLILRIKS